MLFPPPYSPDLNPIEQLFAELRHMMRQAEPRTVEASWRKLGDLLHLVSPTECPTTSQTQATFPCKGSMLYDRIKQLTERDFASVQPLDEVTASLDVARAAVAKAQAAVVTLCSQVAELKVAAPAAAEVYRIGAELGEYVSPGVPLLSLVDLSDVWLRFDMREDLVSGLRSSLCYGNEP